MPRLKKNALSSWANGNHYEAYEHLGAHANRQGTWFRVWAPHADAVSVIGDFNDWSSEADELKRRSEGIWEGYVRGAKAGQLYKFRIQNGDYQADKSDPFAFAMEAPSGHSTEGIASIITDLDDYDWSDEEWLSTRKGPESLEQPMSVYEVHLGSWRQDAPGESLSYRDIAEPLADHVEDLGFTHVELLPVAEHPYYGSWGYQVIGYYAPTFRFGSPADLMYLIDTLHQRGIGVLMDWVPGHFAPDPQGLVNFDGQPLFEYEDERMRHHPDWGTYVFDYGRNGVRNFLISNALFWMEKYHIDGLRVDAVASMLYRDYSRGQDWSPNEHGGRENLQAIDLLQTVNAAVYDRYPDALMIAEESTAWPGVTKPTYSDGLGFLYKWNMGWMHDTLEYMEKDPIYRKHHHGDLSHTLSYAFSEQYTLPLSHDEVVHGKGSLWGKMPGDDWQKSANLRLLLGHMFGHPGKKLLFMGSEFGQTREWNHDESLDWHLLDYVLHRGVMNWTRDLNQLYQNRPALWNDDQENFEWISHQDHDNCVLAYLRTNGSSQLLFVLNATPVLRNNYRIGVPRGGDWKEILNSDAQHYGGSGTGNMGEVEAAPVPAHGHHSSIVLTLPPLSLLVLEPAGYSPSAINHHES